MGWGVAKGDFREGRAMANSQFPEPIITQKVNIMAKGFLVPLFYASIGTLLIFANLNVLLVVAIIAAALLGKLIGCGLFSWFVGASRDEMKLIGVSMMPRGDENIVILQIVLLLGVITTAVYTSLVFAIVATTIIAPILIKLIYRKR